METRDHKISPSEVLQITNILRSIRNNINYALTNRNKNLSVKNFEKVFGYEYYERNFEPKLFIEEVSSVVKNKCYL